MRQGFHRLGLVLAAIPTVYCLYILVTEDVVADSSVRFVFFASALVAALVYFVALVIGWVAEGFFEGSRK